VNDITETPPNRSSKAGNGRVFWPTLFCCCVPNAVTADILEWKDQLLVGLFGQGIYIDPARDFVGVYFSSNGDVPPFGEDKMPGYLRQAAKFLASKGKRK
jgi:hypothetical protein